MTKRSVYRFLVMLFCLLAFSCTVSRASMVKRIPKVRGPKVVKVKLYQHDTIMLVWVDMNGDNKADVAYLYEKNDGYFIEKKIPPDKADELDEFIFEPKV